MSLFGKRGADHPPAPPPKQDLVDAITELSEEIRKVKLSIARINGRMNQGATTDQPTEPNGKEVFAVTPNHVVYKDGSFKIKGV